MSIITCIAAGLVAIRCMLELFYRAEKHSEVGLLIIFLVGLLSVAVYVITGLM
jgi:hypothetical protein